MSMKVCLYMPAFEQGGAQRQLMYLARELATRGLHAVIVHAQKNLEQAHYLELIQKSSVELVNAHSPVFLQSGIGLYRRRPNIFHDLELPQWLKMRILYLAGALSHLKPDILHSYIDIPNCTAGCAAILADVPVHLASFRGTDPQTFGVPWAKLTLSLYRYLMNTGRTYFEANSKAAVTDYAHWLESGIEQIAYVPNGIDPDMYRLPAHQTPAGSRQTLELPPCAPTILTLARYSQNKSPQAMLEIFARVLAVRPESHYILAGLGMTVQDEMGAIVRAHGLGHAVHLLGPRNDIPALLSCADALLLPSLSEGLPNALMEAMAAGVPVVASNVGGIPDLVRHGQEGFLHAPTDVDGMAASVLRLLDDAALRGRMGAAGRQKITEEFTLRKLGDRVLQRYEGLLADAPRSAH